MIENNEPLPLNETEPTTAEAQTSGQEAPREGAETDTEAVTAEAPPKKAGKTAARKKAGRKAASARKATTARATATATRKPSGAPRRSNEARTVRQDAEKLLRTKKSYVDIVSELRTMHPEASPTLASVRWYASRMRQAGVTLPERKRA